MTQTNPPKQPFILSTFELLACFNQSTNHNRRKELTGASALMLMQVSIWNLQSLPTTQYHYDMTVSLKSSNMQEFLNAVDQCLQNLRQKCSELSLQLYLSEFLKSVILRHQPVSCVGFSTIAKVLSRALFHFVLLSIFHYFCFAHTHRETVCTKQKQPKCS